MRCNHCMKELKTDAKFCPYCGKNMEASAPQDTASNDVPNTNTEPYNTKSAKPKRRFPLKLIIILSSVLTVLIIAVVFMFVNFKIVEMDGTSMQDTLKSGDKFVITKSFYTPENGDIVVISKGQYYDKPIVKRIIASGGQTVKLDYENDKLYVDGVELDEPYIKGSTFGGNKGNDYLPVDGSGNIKIPEGKFFVMGDNRAVSLDSRHKKIGLIDKDDIIGELWFVL